MCGFVLSDLSIYCSVKTTTLSSVGLGVLSLLSLMSNFRMNLSILIRQLAAVLIRILLSVQQLEKNWHCNNSSQEKCGSCLIPSIDMLFYVSIVYMEALTYPFFIVFYISYSSHYYKGKSFHILTFHSRLTVVTVFSCFFFLDFYCRVIYKERR